jgi:predicted nucleic acid-binding protein
VRSSAVLADTGPLAALFDPNDHHYPAALTFFHAHEGALLTTLAVVTEVTHLLAVRRQVAFFAWLRGGGASIEPIGVEDISAIERLTRKYCDHPMDFADATLVLVAERTGIGDIVTLDRGFEAFRFRGRRQFNNLMPVRSRH